MVAEPKISADEKGASVHYSVGVLICKDGKYLLIDRVKSPLGFAAPAGHVDEGEDEVQAVKREVKEESGLEVVDYKLIGECELDWNWCSKGIGSHYWHVFECAVLGTLQADPREVKSIGWYAPKEIDRKSVV